MNCLRVAAVLLFGGLFPVMGIAQTITPISACQPAVVVYGNGVWNNHLGALASLEALEGRLRSRLERAGSSADGLRFEYSLNPTEGEFDDLLQANAQLGNLLDARQLAAVLTLRHLSPHERAVRERAYQLLLARAMAVDGGRVVEHATRYIGHIRRGYRVVVVSHSQGNLHVNQAVRYFLTSSSDRDHFSTMAVASPDRLVELSRRDHVTIFGDLVAVTFPATALAMNTRSPTGEWTGHEFVATYLKEGSLAERMILEGTLDTIRELPAPQLNPTSVFITLPPGPLLPRQPVTITATVTSHCPPPPALPPPPTGTVTFTETTKGTTLCTAAPVVAGQATCTTSFPYADIYNVVASYSGDAPAGFVASSASATIDVFPGPLDFTTWPLELSEGGGYELYPVFSHPPGPYDCTWSSTVWAPSTLVYPNCVSGSRGPWGGGLGPAGTTMINLTLSLSSTGQVIDSVTRPVVTHHAPGFDPGTPDYNYQCVDRLWVDANGYLNHHFVVDITVAAHLSSGGSAIGAATANITSCGGWRVEVQDGKTVCHRDAGLPRSATMKIHDEQRFFSGLLVTSVLFNRGLRHIYQDGVINRCTVIEPP